MKISYNWLQTYFTEKLPSPERLAEILTFHVFEVERIENILLDKNKDTVLDIKVLPDRAHYALSHRGIAYEIAASTGLKKNDLTLENISNAFTVNSDIEKVMVNNIEQTVCRRYCARKIEGIAVTKSPEWLREKLESIGQRSINTIVDATNFVMLDMNQPLHAFDADKISGQLTVRYAKMGESITTLDTKNITLDDSMLVIADDVGPLALAGIKGGNRAAVTEATTSIILESANFNATAIRRISQKVGIRNDSSKRFENDITPEFAVWGIEEVTKLISELTHVKNISAITDVYPKPQESRIITVDSKFISEILGTTTIIPEHDLEALFSRLHFLFKKINLKKEIQELSTVYEIVIPPYRLDLTIPQDIAEEVGRIVGYDTLPHSVLPPTSFKPTVHKEFYYLASIRRMLVEMGFSEVYLYSLVDSGEIEIISPIASDKNFLRTNLHHGIKRALEYNAHNADLLGLSEIKIFEIGNVFTLAGEFTHLAFGVQHIKKQNMKELDKIQEIVIKLSEFLGVRLPSLESGTVYEINIDKIFKELPQPKPTELDSKKFKLDGHTSQDSKNNVAFQPLSAYPFAVRDIAVFTPDGTTEGQVRTIIKEKSNELLVRMTLFDVFNKKFSDGSVKVSYAYRLVFQSHEKTLSEAEISLLMKSITDALNSMQGWEVR